MAGVGINDGIRLMILDGEGGVTGQLSPKHEGGNKFLSLADALFGLTGAKLGRKVG